MIAEVPELHKMLETARFHYDIFVSFASADDKQDAVGTRWVSEFVADLTCALSLLGRKDVRLVHDTQNSQLAGEYLLQHLQHMRTSAVFLAIVSPNYVRSEWTMEEFNTFRQSVGGANRIVAIDLLPLDNETDYPQAMLELYRLRFFERIEKTDLPMIIGRQNNRALYAQRIQQLASHIVQRYRELADSEDGQAPVTTRENSPAPPPAKAVVLLGRVTDDMRNERARLRSHLEQFGIRVIPSHDYPDGSASFKDKLKADLALLAQAKKSAFVQLVGPFPSVRWEEFPNGYERYQIEAATRAGVRWWCWRPDSIDPAGIEDKAHRDFLASAQAMSLPRLSQEIVSYCKPPPEDEEQEEKKKIRRRKGTVFVNTTEADLPIAKQVCEALRKLNVGVVLPDFDDYDDVDRNLQICDAVVIVSGNDLKWVQRQLRHYLKKKQDREREALIRIYETRESPSELGIVSPEVRHVARVEDLIEDLRSERLVEGWDAPGGGAPLARSESRVQPTLSARRPKRLGNVWEQRSALSATSAVQPAATTDHAADPVTVTAFAPSSCRPGKQMLVQVYLHIREDALAAADLAREADPDAFRRGATTLTAEIARGQRVDVVLEGKGLEIDEPRQQLRWNGSPTACQFVVSPAAACDIGTVIVRVRLFLETVPVSSLAFKLAVVPSDMSVRGEPTIRRETARRYHRAFLSYASEDRAEVLKRAQGLRAAGLSFFQDLLSLDPGERWERRLYQEIDRSDLFLLFWSTRASQSEWVMREVAYALDRRNGSAEDSPDLVPVVIEGPPPPAPPEQLRHIHFNDPLNYVIAAENRVGI